MKSLEVKQVTIKNNQQFFCEDFNFQLLPGEIWGILGPNGCGKSSLLQAFAGLFPIEKGDILLDTHSLKTLSRKTIAQSIGLLFQEIAIPLPQTIWNYCLAARYPHLTYFEKENEYDKAIVEQSLEIMGLIPRKQRLITQLSGGEKRRLAIAALLSQTPAIYLLDEPTNHLDIKHQMAALNHFHQLAKKSSAAIMMTLHDINLAQQFCDAVLLMLPTGEILQGKTSALLTADNLTRLYQHSIVPLSVNGTIVWQPQYYRCNE
ncbi:MAG: ABC transporter ATP-binding protein [Gammaproteobacteria bacterium]|nr:ABC transporter ATP-binding protein [Gammaproteobacteria bacterium]